MSTPPKYEFNGEQFTVTFHDQTLGARPSKGDRYVIKHTDCGMWKVEHLQEFPKARVNCGQYVGLENTMHKLFERRDIERIEQQKRNKGEN